MRNGLQAAGFQLLAGTSACAARILHRSLFEDLAMRPFLLIIVAALPCLSPLAAAEPTANVDELRGAVRKALPLIQQGAAGHIRQKSCFACHNQAIPVLAMVTSGLRGFETRTEDVQKQLVFIADFLEKNRKNYREGKGQGGAADTAGYALWTLAVGGWKPDDTTAAVAEYLLLCQKDRDHWRSNAQRPPTEASPFTTTYVSLRGLQAYGTADQKERIEKRFATVRDWLVKTPGRDTEDRVFRLRGLQLTGASAEAIASAADDLRKSQRTDGGWSQTREMDADAYATGTALVALHEVGNLPTTDAVYQRGLQFLLRTQLEDGSWYVKSRSRPFQTYYETGFPHGKDQFISSVASSWAATALALACPPTAKK